MFLVILLMEEIRLTTWDVQNHVNTGINYQPQLVSRISEPSTVAQLNFFFFWGGKLLLSKLATGHHLEDGRFSGEGRGGVKFAPFRIGNHLGSLEVNDDQISKVFSL